MCENDPLCLFWKEPLHSAANTFRAMELAINKQRFVRLPEPGQIVRLLTLIGPDEAELVRLAIAEEIEEKEIQ